MKKFPLSTWSSTESTSCKVCSRWTVACQIWTCRPCIDIYIADPELLIRKRKHVPHSTTQDLDTSPASLNNDIYGAMACISTCIACEPKIINTLMPQHYHFRSKVSLLEAKLSFLQQLDYSSITKDFTGDISFRMTESDEPVQPHRFMFASKSLVFKKMMDIDMIEKIHIKGISAAVNFMHTGEIVFCDDACPEEALKFAHKYEIQRLKDTCEKEHAANITSENLVDLLSISYQFRTEILMDKAKEFFTNYPHIHSTLFDSISKFQTDHA